MYERTILSDDDELLRRWRAGDRAAGSELCGRHHEAARRYARRLARGVADPDDIVAEAFAKVLRAMLGGLGPRDGFRRYLFASVRSCAFDAHRSRVATTDQVPDLSVEGGFDAVAAAGGPMHRAFAELPERARLVLWRIEVEGWTAGEVAEADGSTPGAVSALAYRSRTQLRRRYLAHVAASGDRERQVAARSGTAAVATAVDRPIGEVTIDLTDAALAAAVGDERALRSA